MNLKLSVLGESTIMVEFDSVTNADVYYVSVSPDSRFDSILPASAVNNGKLTKTLNELRANMNYTITVIAEVEGSNSTESSDTAVTGKGTLHLL